MSAAHLEAVKNLAAKTNNERNKQQLNRLAPLLSLEMNGAKQVPQTILEKYAGKYTPQIEDDYFLIEDVSVPPENQARVRFVRNSAGTVTELRLVVADGRTFPRVRE